MNFRDMQENDLNDVFFNSYEFGTSATVKKNLNSIILIETDEYELNSSSQRAFFLKSSDIVANSIEEGDVLVIDGVEREILNVSPISSDRRINILVLKND
jgi:hypothetical protein